MHPLARTRGRRLTTEFLAVLIRDSRMPFANMRAHSMPCGKTSRTVVVSVTVSTSRLRRIDEAMHPRQDDARRARVHARGRN